MIVPINNNHLENIMVIGRCRSLVAEHWRLKPETLGSISGGTTFLLSLCRFKVLRTVTAQIISIGLRTWVSPIYQAPYAVMKLIRFFRNHGMKNTILYWQWKLCMGWQLESMTRPCRLGTGGWSHLCIIFIKLSLKHKRL